MNRTRLALAVLMVTWAAYDAMYAEPWRAAQVTEDLCWLALILYWPHVRRWPTQLRDLWDDKP